MQIRVNLVLTDRPLIERIKYYFKGREDIQLIFSEKPQSGESTDIYIAPVIFIKDLSTYIHQKKQVPPVIYYGNISFLRKAFLAGCTDYLKDPWTIEELSLRLTKLIKEIKKMYTFSWGNISFIGTDIITDNGRCSLSFHEYKVFKSLIQHRGDVVPRDVLFYSLWNCPGSRESRIIDVHISSIRRKLKCILPENLHETIIISIRGIGYMIK